MPTTNFGLTDQGYLAPSYEELLDSVQDDFLRVFPSDLVLTSNSNAGILSRLIAWREYEQIQAQQQVYYSAFVSTATGSALDRLGANVGLPRKVDRPASATLTIVTDGEYLIEAGTQFETEDGYIFDLTDDVLTTLEGDKWQAVGNAEAEDTGAITNVEPNTITVVYNPDESIISVTNPEKASGGQDYEEDSQYRARLIAENANQPSPTLNGVRSALLNVQGVREVNIVENQFATTDKYGNPPYSVHIYCLGGTKQDIADCLISHIAVGITLAGSVECDAVDVAGNTKQVYFDYATDRPIFVNVKIKTNAEWNVDEGSNYVKDTIVEFINQLKMGDTVYLTKLYPQIYAISGVDDAKITLGTDRASLSNNDITLDKFEAPSCATDNVEVDINA